MGELKIIQERFIALQTAIINDEVVEVRSELIKDLQHISKRILAEGSSFIEVTLPQLGRALDQGLISGTFKSPCSFSCFKQSVLPKYLYKAFSQVFDDTGNLLQHPKSSIIRYLRQALLLDSKLETACPPEKSLVAINGYKERLRTLRKVRVPQDHVVLVRARALIKDMFSPLSLANIEPGHGPGAVFEKLDRDERWDFHSWPLRAERMYPFSVFAVHGLRGCLAAQGYKLQRVQKTRCCLVPKDFRGPRLISVESTATQYLQQGQMRLLMKYIAEHPILGLSLKLRDQTHNQKHAQCSYDTGDVTLDLSNASDTVSAVLVWYLFRDLPRLRRQLFSTRSDVIVFADGTEERITSFAPMGSAICFPVESIVFWALAMASLDVCTRRFKDGKPTLNPRALASRISVFGDDIIVPDYCLPVLTQTLLSIGCEPNMSKTCWQTPFRESCGSEWYDGVDVTLIRNKRLTYSNLNIKDHPSVCELQRKFFVRGNFAVAALLSDWANKILPTPVTSISHYGKVGGRSLGSKVEFLAGLDFFSRGELHLDQFRGLIGWHGENQVGRFNRKLQKWQSRLPGPFQDTREWSVEGYPRLMARVTGDVTDRVATRSPCGVKMAWTDIPILV